MPITFEKKYDQRHEEYLLLSHEQLNELKTTHLCLFSHYASSLNNKENHKTVQTQTYPTNCRKIFPTIPIEIERTVSD